MSKKLQSKQKVTVKGFEFGGSKYAVCGSMEPENPAELNGWMESECLDNIDVLEIVVNRYEDMSTFCTAWSSCRAAVPDLPVIVRIKETGAAVKVEKNAGLNLLKDVIENSLADCIDIEVNDAEFVDQVKAMLKGSGIKLILTLQNYRGVIGADEVLKAAQDVEAMGADLVRTMFLSADDVDVLRIAQAARKAKEEAKLSVPFCISSIGDVGLMLRLFGERCGNDFGSYQLCRKDSGNFEFETLDEYCRLRDIYAIDDKY
ncbi:MAG: type I 3-dehydroquinate dehydratase [Butyricicoccus sp.]